MKKVFVSVGIAGIRLFNNMDQSKFTFDIIDVINSPIVTHLRYEVNNK